MSRKNMKTGSKIKLVFLLMISTLIIIVAMVNDLTRPVDPKDDTIINFEIKENQVVGDILDSLEESSLIKSSFVGNLYVRFNGITTFYPGTYELKKSYSLNKVLSIVNTIPSREEITVTFNEGLRAVDYSKIVSDNFDVSEKDFLKALNDRKFIEDLAKKYQVIDDYDFSNDAFYKLEGLLAPNTYNFFVNANEKDIIDLLVSYTNAAYLENIVDFKSSSMNVSEIFTLASIVEAEEKVPVNRKVVAGIFHNRLEQGMQLGSDVTTLYGLQLAAGERNLTMDELNKKNSYNTRSSEMIGLPVGPINNPSFETVLATLNYTKTDALFFVHDKNGELYTTKTYEEHNAIIAKLQADGLWYEDAN